MNVDADDDELGAVVLILETYIALAAHEPGFGELGVKQLAPEPASLLQPVKALAKLQDQLIAARHAIFLQYFRRHRHPARHM